MNPATVAARRQIWKSIQALAPERGLDPEFVYALVRIESRFDPRAENGEHRGLLQLTPRLWHQHSRLSYLPSVWNPQLNLTVGMDSLAAAKRTLAEKGVFSYALLWASYHYGTDFVAAHGYDMSRIPRPSDTISYKLWAGDAHPFPPPK